MNPQGEDSVSETYQSLSHSKWDCKYHVVFVPKRRRQAICGQARRQLGAIFPALARQRECQIIEGHLMPAWSHVHRDSTQAPGGTCDRVSEGEERHCDGPLERQRAKLLRRAFLGPRLCRIYRRVRTGTGPHVHPRAGCCGWSTRTVLNDLIKARTARRLEATDQPPLRRPNSSSHPLRGGCLTGP